MLELNYKSFPKLETERLHLRQLTMDDTSVLFEMRSNPLMNRFTDRSRLKTLEEAEEKMKTILSMVERRDGIAWAIELKESRQMIGDISFWRLVKEHYRAEIGYAILPDYWQKGYMTEAIKCVSITVFQL